MTDSAKIIQKGQIEIARKLRKYCLLLLYYNVSTQFCEKMAAAGALRKRMENEESAQKVKQIANIRCINQTMSYKQGIDLYATKALRKRLWQNVN